MSRFRQTGVWKKLLCTAPRLYRSGPRLIYTIGDDWRTSMTNEIPIGSDLLFSFVVTASSILFGPPEQRPKGHYRPAFHSRQQNTSRRDRVDGSNLCAGSRASFRCMMLKPLLNLEVPVSG